MSEPDQPIINVEGSLVALGPLQREHLSRYLNWIKDFETTRLLGVPMAPMTVEQETAWFERAAIDESRQTFTIYKRSTWSAIGNCSLFEVHMPNRRAEAGIMIGAAAK